MDEPPDDASLGAALHELGRHDEAIVAHRRAIAMHRRALAALQFNLGASLAASGRFAEAADEFRAALADAPDLARAEQGLGFALAGLGRLDLAIAAYQRAIALDPELHELHAPLAVLQLQVGALDDGLATAERACAARGDDAGGHGLRGAALARLGRHVEAAAAYGRARALAPDRVEVHFNCALGAEALGDLDGAIAAYRDALDCEPDHRMALINLSRLLVDRGRTADLLPIYERLLAIDPTSTMMPHLLAALRGELPAAAPRAYVVDLFDGIAAHFDQLLVGRLGYRVPERMRAAIERVAPGRRFAAVLDLGCGTGLAGVQLRPLVAQLHGVDLAPRMIEQARAKGVYDQLDVADVLDFLDGGAARYELIVAADVLIYLGELAPLFAAARRRLAPGGLLMWSVERGDDADVALRTTGRYAHGRAYLERLAAAHDLAIRAFEPIDVRHEASGVIPGWLFVLQA